MMPGDTLKKCHELLKPGGYISISTWAYLPWYSHVARSVELLPESERPTMPSESEVRNILYKNRPYDDPDYISTILKEAGFTDVSVTSRETLASGGTPIHFCDVMYLPLKMISGFWVKDQSAKGDEEKEKLVRAVQEKLLGLLEEEFGKGGATKMTFKAIMGSGRKAQ
jgi:hypothetical protein